MQRRVHREARSLGKPVYATYLGGSGDDYGDAIAVDPQGNVYVAGDIGEDVLSPHSVPFPVTPGAAFTTPGTHFTGFMVKLNPGGQTVYSTFLPALYPVSGMPRMAMAIDTGGNACVALTVDPTGTPFPATSGAFQTKPPQV